MVLVFSHSFTILTLYLQVDLAYIKIDSGVVKSLHGHYNYVTTDKISHHKERLDAANYCVIGIPENNIKFKDKIMETG